MIYFFVTFADRFEVNDDFEPRLESLISVEREEALRDPALDELGPILDEPESIFDDSDPALDEANPILDEANPALDETNPTLDEADPALDEANPTLDKVDPALDEANPTLDKPDPALDEANPTWDEANSIWDEANLTWDGDNPTLDEANPALDAVDDDLAAALELLLFASLTEFVVTLRDTSVWLWFKSIKAISGSASVVGVGDTVLLLALAGLRLSVEK